MSPDAETPSPGTPAPDPSSVDRESTQASDATASVTDAETNATPSSPPTSSGEWEAVQAELRALRRDLAEARTAKDAVQEQADRYHANWQRSTADFLNWKRRSDQEKADALRLGEAAVISDLLRVLDDFERAFGALPQELRRLTWIEGIHMIWGKTFTIFESRGLVPIEAVGRDFDPREHEAVMREDDADPSEQTAVVQDLQRGYRFHDRVLRPTLVKIGRPAAATASGAAVDSAATGASPNVDEVDASGIGGTDGAPTV